jgi:hypothetical protein
MVTMAEWELVSRSAFILPGGVSCGKGREARCVRRVFRSSCAAVKVGASSPTISSAPLITSTPVFLLLLIMIFFSKPPRVNYPTLWRD